MEEKKVIQIRDLSKMYKLYDKPSDRLKESLGLTKKKCYREHYALSHVSFDVHQGETVGIIGTNGSGKSTILKIITGVLNPTDGEVIVDGRISALLELGAGFNMEFCRISFVYESKVLPIGAVFGILSWLSCPLVILLAYAPWVAGTLNTVDYLLICMLPLFCAKLANSIFVDLTSYKNLMISKNKILGVMNEPEETGSMEPLQIATHEITFDSVDFSYVPGEPVLKHATFTVPDQKLTAIVGDSGSGKSTILNLIAKYYEATGGTISIGGKPINHIAAERVLEQISMVDQDVFLFDDTIRENIRHARPEATDEEIEAACREANCGGFIRKMEKGYDTPTGENGNLLSGGERQRISIARAILKNSPILLLDEATASLDIENELAVKQAIANLLKEKKTVVMIAHTLSIVKNADQILVMGDGRIAESGTHEELLAKGGKYAAMWNAEQKISA